MLHAELVQFPQRVVSRILVHVAQRRIVEDRVYEIVDVSAKLQTRHSDVDQLRSDLADYRAAQQFSVRGGEDQFHQTAGVADNVPAGVISKLATADDVLDQRLTRLDPRFVLLFDTLLGLADRGDLRNGV